MKHTFLLSAIALTALLTGCNANSGSFPKDQRVDVTIERTNWEVQQLSGDRVAETNTFELSNATLTEAQLSLCLKTATAIQDGTLTLYEANIENCSDYQIQEWDGDRFLARPSGNVAYSLVCTAKSREIDCYTIGDDMPAEAKSNPEEYKDTITEQTVIRLR